VVYSTGARGGLANHDPVLASAVERALPVLSQEMRHRAQVRRILQDLHALHKEMRVCALKQRQAGEEQTSDSAPLMPGEGGSSDGGEECRAPPPSEHTSPAPRLAR